MFANSTDPVRGFSYRIQFRVLILTNGVHVLQQNKFNLPFDEITYLGLTKSIVVHCNVVPALISYRNGPRKIYILNNKKSMEDFKRFIEANGHALEDITLEVQVLEEQENEIVPNIIPTLNRDLKLKIKMENERVKGQSDISPENSNEAMELIVDEIAKLFDCEVEPRLKHFFRMKLGAFVENIFETKTCALESEAENISQKREEGMLSIVRQKKSNLADLLKSGCDVVVPMDNDILILNFFKDTKMKKMQLNWLNNEHDAYNCNEVKIPVSIGNDINYIFPTDADFMKKFNDKISLFENKKKTEPNSKRKQSVEKSKEHQSETKMARLTIPTEQSTMTTETQNSDEIPTSLVCYLESFKSGLLNDIRNTVTELVGSSSAQPNPEAVDGAIAAATAEYENHNLIESLKEMRLVDDENGPSTSKHRTKDGCSKKMCPSKRRECGKLVEVSSNLFVFSKAGFKIRMPRNSSRTVRFHLIKYGKFRGLKDEPVLEVHAASSGIECCVKPVPGTENKIATVDKNSYSFYDIRIKTKDKSGKFRLYFSVVHHNKNCGRSFKVDIRVRKGYVLDGTDAVYVGGENQTPNKLNTAVGDFAMKATRSEQTSEKFDDNQEEYFYSPSSDSEDSDIEDSKPEMLKDDRPGLDSILSAIFHEKSSMPKNDSDDDAYSTISFLHDEDEARDNTKLVHMPSFFFPEQFPQPELLESDFVPVRVKYKTMKKNGKNSASSGCSVNDEAAANGDEMFVSSVSQTAPNRESESINFLEETVNHIHNRSVYPNVSGLKEAFIPNDERAVYPNMKGFKEDVNPITEKPVYPNMKGLKEDMTADANMAYSSENAKASTSKYQAASDEAHELFDEAHELFGNAFNQFKTAFERNDSPSEKETKESTSSDQSKEHARKSDPSSPMNILPEKVFETAGDVFKTVFSTFKTQAGQGVENIRQHAENTITKSQDIINTISNEVGNIASAVVDSSDLISPQPIPTQAPSTSHTFVTVNPNDTWRPFSFDSIPSGKTTSARVGSPGTSATPNQTEKRRELPSGSVVRPSLNEERQLLRKCMERIIKEEYSSYPAVFVRNLITLNDMGFFNHQHNCILLKQNGNNLDKVIEILLRY